MNHTTVRFGVLGSARINRKVLPAIQRSPFAKLVAIGSRDLDKARAAAKTFEIPKAYGSYEDVLQDPEVDAVYIPLPNALHLEWVEKAAAAKKHVLVEKPLALTLKDVETAYRVCEANGVELLDGFMWPHHPRTTAINDALHSNSFGSIRHVSTTFTFLLDTSKSDIRRTKEMGGGALYDIGCYCVRGALFSFETEPVAVTATAVWQNDIDWEMTALLEFPEGATASLHFGFLCPYQSTWEVSGTKKRLVVPQPWSPDEPAKLQLWQAGSLESEINFPQTNHIYEMIDTFSSAVLSRKRLLEQKAITLSLSKTIDALYASARKGERILL